MSLSLFHHQEENGSSLDLGGAGGHAEWVLGRIFAQWCGHCVRMKKDWEKLKAVIHKEKGGKVEVKDIEDVVMNTELPKLNQTHFKHHSGVKSEGFPTIFIYKIANADSTLEYYKGERSYGAMKHWVDSKLSTAPGHKKKSSGGLTGGLIGGMIGKMRKGGSRKRKSLRRRKNKTRRTM